jgi:hypothetical protein
MLLSRLTGFDRDYIDAWDFDFDIDADDPKRLNIKATWFRLVGVPHCRATSPHQTTGMDAVPDVGIGVRGVRYASVGWGRSAVFWGAMGGHRHVQQF